MGTASTLAIIFIVRHGDDTWASSELAGTIIIADDDTTLTYGAHAWFIFAA